MSYLKHTIRRRLLAALALVAINQNLANVDAAEAKKSAETTIKTVEPADIRAKIDAEKGKVLFVNFWATWCPPCVEEMPDHAKFYRDNAGDEVAYLSFSADDVSTIEDAVKPFAKKHELPFPIHVMNAKSPDELEAALKLGWDGALPTTFLFNQEGKVVKTWVGAVSAAEMKEALESVSSEDASAQS